MFPVWISDGQLRVIARMEAGRLVTLAQYASEYLQLGWLPVGPISPEYSRKHPELGHRAPVGCIDQVAIASEGPPPSTLSAALLRRICHYLGLVLSRAWKRPCRACKTDAWLITQFPWSRAAIKRTDKKNSRCCMCELLGWISRHNSTRALHVIVFSHL